MQLGWRAGYSPALLGLLTASAFSYPEVHAHAFLTVLGHRGGGLHATLRGWLSTAGPHQGPQQPQKAPSILARSRRETPNIWSFVAADQLQQALVFPFQPHQQGPAGAAAALPAPEPLPPPARQAGQAQRGGCSGGGGGGGGTARRGGGRGGAVGGGPAVAGAAAGGPGGGEGESSAAGSGVVGEDDDDRAAVVADTLMAEVCN